MVSVVIPVYNTEAHLRQCLDSIIGQTLREIEIICVDDGSTDGSLKILREYERKDPRVRVLTQKNKFAGVARNRGLEQAQGEYCIFLDADDFFDRGMLEVMYGQASAHKADICLCNADCFHMLSERFGPLPGVLNPPEIEKQPFNAFDLKDIFGLTSPAPWNKLFSSDFIYRTSLQFQATPRINDLYFTYCALALAERIVYVDAVYVHYRLEQGSNLQSGVYKTPELCCEVLLAIKQRLQKEACWPHVQESFINATIAILGYNLRCMEDHPEAKKKLARAIDSRYYKVLGIQELPSNRITDVKSAEGIQLARFEAQCDDPSTPLVSLVVPVLNNEKNLQTCLDSLLKQSLDSIEIICVDSSSQDNLLQILKGYALRDSRIRLVKEEKKEGALYARRAGVLESRGHYIMFADPDDCFAPDACRTLYKIIHDEQIDILQFSGREKHNGNINKSLNGKIYYAPKCKLAYQRMGESYSVLGEDLFQMVFIFLYANSYREESALSLYQNVRSREKSYSQIVEIESPQINETMIHLQEYFYCAMSVLKYALNSRLDPEQEQKIRHAYQRMIGEAMRCYKELPKKDRRKVILPREMDNIVFKQIIDQDKLNKSASFRIYRMITWLPRKLYGGLWCCQEHGLHYTMQRVREHLANKAN